jgi:hypothetical protein
MAGVICLFGCTKESDYQNTAERNVVSDETSISFKEMLMLISVKATDSTFLVVESIDSVTLFVNNQFWSKSSSQSVDIDNVDKLANGNRYETVNKLNYLLIADQTVETSNFTTAGDFAKYMNSFFELKPGEYACLIESFQVRFNDNTVKKYYPLEYRIFKVEANTERSFLGEIELKID